MNQRWIEHKKRPLERLEKRGTWYNERNHVPFYQLSESFHQGRPQRSQQQFGSRLETECDQGKKDFLCGKKDTVFPENLVELEPK